VGRTVARVRTRAELHAAGEDGEDLAAVVQQLRHRLAQRVQRGRRLQPVGRAAELAPLGQVLLEEGGVAGQRLRTFGGQAAVDVHIDLRGERGPRWARALQTRRA
jgi:hypothetical protein